MAILWGWFWEHVNPTCLPQAGPPFLVPFEGVLSKQRPEATPVRDVGGEGGKRPQSREETSRQKVLEPSQ